MSTRLDKGHMVHSSVYLDPCIPTFKAHVYTEIHLNYEILKGAEVEVFMKATLYLLNDILKCG